jgi:hypothetical protein
MTGERFAQVQTTCESAAVLGIDAGQAKTALDAGAFVGVPGGGR